jgi:23S rRNA pseudouridine2457 synthase
VQGALSFLKDQFYIRIVSRKDKHLYYIIHKPYKVLSQFTDEDGNPGLGSLYKLPKDVYAVGRLDLDSEGLLLLTNDKTLNHRLLDPKYQHQRTYWVEVEGEPTAEALQQFAKGLTIRIKGKEHRTRPAKIRLLKDVSIPEREPPVNRVKHPITSWLEITLTEGKNRQVRRMTAAIGHPTLRLIRVAIEGLELDPLPSGGITQLPRKTVYGRLGVEMRN